MSKRDLLTQQNPSLNSPSTKKNSNLKQKRSKPNKSLPNMKKQKNTNTTKSPKNIMTINKKNPEEKETTDHSSTGTEMISLYRPRYLKPQKNSYPSPNDKNSESNLTR